MLALGVILLVLTAGVVVLVVAGATNQTASFDVGAFSIEMNTVGVFLTGAATVLLMLLGLSLIRAGLRGANRRRKEKKQLHRLTEEREAQERKATTSGTDTATRADTDSDATPTRTDHAADDTATRSDDQVTGPDRSNH